MRQHTFNNYLILSIMRCADVVSFVFGFSIMSFVLYLIPTITMYPNVNLTYRDDDGICYTYEREEIVC